MSGKFPFFGNKTYICTEEPMNSEEYIVLKRLRDGDVEALDVLYLHYAPKVRDFVFRLVRDMQEAEDITHDIFLRIWEQRQTVGNVLSFKNYLFRMTRNAVFNAFKHRRVEQSYQAQTLARDLGEIAPEKPDERVSTEDLMQLIDLAVSNMPEQRRKVFCMSRYDHKSYNEIARELNISPKTVQYHISGALAELRKLLSALAVFI